MVSRTLMRFNICVLSMAPIVLLQIPLQAINPVINTLANKKTGNALHHTLAQQEACTHVISMMPLVLSQTPLQVKCRHCALTASQWKTPHSGTQRNAQRNRSEKRKSEQTRNENRGYYLQPCDANPDSHSCGHDADHHSPEVAVPIKAA